MLTLVLQKNHQLRHQLIMLVLMYVGSTGRETVPSSRHAVTAHSRTHFSHKNLYTMNTPVDTTMASTRTYLRVKRPRHVAPLPSLRVEGLLKDGSKRARPNTMENLANLLNQSTYITQQQQHKPPASSAVWKRVAIDSSATPHDAEAVMGSSHKRCLRFVDAVLDDMDDDNGDQVVPRKKRRRLALTLVVHEAPPAPVKAAPPVNKNVILDPLSRLIQESLQSVLSGERTISQHLEFLTKDSRLSNNIRRSLQWMHIRGAGNILHAAALLNDVEGASSVLAWDIPSLAHAVDGDGQTPYQLAVAVGHSQVAQVLELHSEPVDDDNIDYVYDVFCLDTNMQDATPKKDDNDENVPTTVELRGGIGYWNEHGELILEAMSTMEENAEESRDDDDEDSNCEDHQGNDYPEDDDDDLWDQDSFQEESFRHRPIYMMDGARVENKSIGNEDDDDEYNAQYGLWRQ